MPKNIIDRRPLPTAEKVIKDLPITEKIRQEVQQDIVEIKKIIEGKDPRKLLIIGPCSAWPNQAVIEYAEKLKPLADKVSDKLKIILRVYTQKPRTTVGWTGPFNQPDPYKEADIADGIYYCRDMMIKVAKIGLPMADEAVFTHNDGYVVDLLSWIAIGARSTEDQEHRIFASMINHPVGMKNPTSGHIETGINSVIAAQHPHTFSMQRKQLTSKGNAHAHLILRGGYKGSNICLEKLKKATNLLFENNINNPSIIVDASHDNCIDPKTGKKDYLRQPKVIMDTLKSMRQDPEIFTTVKGFMAESFLKDGNQNLNNYNKASDVQYGVSVTDACIGFEKTEKLILDLAQSLKDK